LLAFDAQGFTRAGEIKTPIAVGAYVFERGGLSFPVGEIAGRGIILIVLIIRQGDFLPDLYKTI
jgi:hypothetical protein